MENIAHLRPRRYIRPLRGETNPQLIKFNDNVEYVVKFQGNPVSDQVLINEYLANELIHELGFSGLSGKVVAVDANFISNEPRLRAAAFKAGLQFGSPFVSDHEDFNAAHLGHLLNRDDLPQVMVLDTFICNADRHSGNLLLLFEDRTRKNKDCRFVLVDHSHVFRRPKQLGKGEWNDRSLKELRDNDALYGEVVNLSLVPLQMDTFEPFLIRLEALTPDRIKVIIDSIPPEWVLSATDRMALIEFLVTRKDKVRTIISNHLTLRHRQLCRLEATTA